MTVGTRLVGDDGRVAGVVHEGGGLPPEHSPRPFVHPLLTPLGRTVSDDAPDDHPWHHGLGIAVSTIDVAGEPYPANLWGGPTFSAEQGYVHLPNNGSQRVRASSSEAGRITQQLEWSTAGGAPFLSEERTWRAGTLRAEGVYWSRIDVRSRWTNLTSGALGFGSPTTAGRPAAGYGGFFLRLAQSFEGADIVVPTHAETIGADPGRKTGGVAGGVMGSRAPHVVAEADVMGALHQWVGLRCPSASVLMVPDRANVGGDTPWFVRSAGTPMLCAAPFFHEVVDLRGGNVVDWAWSILVADGSAPDTAFEAAAAGTASAAASASSGS